MSAAPVLTSDPAFLQDQVLRLSAELARARSSGVLSDTADDDAAQPVGGDPDWLSGVAHMPPLLRSYDVRIHELERSEASQRDRASAAEAELRMTQQTSDRMRVELQGALEATMRSEASRGMGGIMGGKPDPLARELQARLDVLYEENEILVEQQRETGEELERLRAEKLAQAHDHMSLVKQISALRDEMAEADVRARRAAESRDRAREELQKCAAELLVAQENTQSAMGIAERHAAERDAALASVAEHRGMLETLNGRAANDREALQADLAVARASEREVRERAKLLEGNLQSATEREAAIVERLSAELQDKHAGAEALNALESRCAEAEGRVESLAGELATAQKQLHEAGIEHQHVTSKLAIADGALQRSEERLGALAGEEKTRREALTHSLRSEALSRTAALEEEVRSMEVTVADLTHQLQRAQRERGPRAGGIASGGGMMPLALGGLAAHPGVFGASPVHVTYAPSAAGGAVPGGGRAMDELAGRLGEAERERDGLESQRRQLAMQLRSVNEQSVAERNAAGARMEQVQRQQRRLEDEVGELRQERARLLGQVAELDEQLHHAKHELARDKHASAEELRITSEASTAKAASLERALADARALHDQSSKEVEEMIRAQEELSSRYRAEAKTVAERSEALVGELRAEAERLTIRNAELSASLQQLTSANGQLERADREKVSTLAVLKKQLTEVQAVRAQQNGLLTQLREAEKAWYAEKKVLMRQLKASELVSESSGAAAARRAAAPEMRSARAAAAAEIDEALAKARLEAQAAEGTSA